MARIAARYASPRGGVDRHRAAAQRLAEPPSHPKPAIAASQGQAAFEGFLTRARASGVFADVLPALADAPRAVQAFLTTNGFGHRIAFGADARLANLSWSEVGLDVRTAGDGDRWGYVAVSHALCVIGESGSVVLASGPDNPALAAFLPDVHLVVAERATCVGSFEEALRFLGCAGDGALMPRALTIVSGASRTGDIGGRIVHGAHGPRQVAVFIYGPDGAAGLGAGSRI